MLSIKVLMETIVVVFFVLEQQRRRFGLSGGVATIEKLTVFLRVTRVHAHCGIPPIRDRREMRVNRAPQFADHIGQRILEIFVFTAPKTMTAHHHSTTKPPVMRIQRGNCATLLLRNKMIEHSTALRIQLSRDIPPVDSLHFHSNLAPLFAPHTPIVAF